MIYKNPGDCPVCLRDTLIGQGIFVVWDLIVEEIEGDRHNEAFLSRRFPGAVEFLFPGNS